MYNKRVRFGGVFTGLSMSHESMAVTVRVANRPWTMIFLLGRKLLRAVGLIRRNEGAVAMQRKGEVPPDVAAVEWYHTIDLGGGVATPGVFDHRPILDSYRLPARMDGLRVLDVATWDGFWAFEFERRGAKEVVALDIATRAEVDLTPAVRRRIIATHGEDFLRAATGRGFEVARKRLGSSVTRRLLNIYNISPETVGMFDVVHVGDVLLHLKYPQRALENVLSVTSGYAIISEPYVPELDTLGERNLVRYLSGAEDTTWWNFSFDVLKQMVLDAGFERIEVVNRFHFGGLYDHAVIHAFPPDRSEIVRTAPPEGVGA